jgi:hypothetical protein
MPRTKTAEPNQTIWPHLVVGFVAGAVAVRLLGGESSALAVPGLVGAGLGYLLHCWQHPLAKCWWPSRGLTGLAAGFVRAAGLWGSGRHLGQVLLDQAAVSAASAEPGVCAGRGAGHADPAEATEEGLTHPGTVWHSVWLIPNTGSDVIETGISRREYLNQGTTTGSNPPVRDEQDG